MLSDVGNLARRRMATGTVERLAPGPPLATGGARPSIGPSGGTQAPVPGGRSIISVDEVRAWVESFDPERNPRARKSRDAILALLADARRLPSRNRYTPGHITTSAIVLSPDGGKVLLVFHPRLRRWLQPGGHLETPDRTIVDAARREVLEETGVLVDPEFAPALIGVDVHDIPAARGEPLHRHHDLVFRFVAGGQVRAAGGQALRSAWCPVGRLRDFDADAPLRRAVRRARRDLARLRRGGVGPRLPRGPRPGAPPGRGTGNTRRS